MKKKLNPNNLKNWEVDKEAAQNFLPGASDHCLRQGASEGENFDAKPTSSKTNSLSCLGLYPVFLGILYFLFFVGLSIFLYQVILSDHVIEKKLLLESSDYHDEDFQNVWERLEHRIKIQPFNLISLIVFMLAILHTFFCHQFNHLADWLVKKNTAKNGVYTETFGSEVLRFMGEIEVVFGLWVIPLMILMSDYYNWHTALNYLNDRQYTEPIFVVVIMVLASTKPILKIAEDLMRFVAKLGGESVKAWWLTLLTIGPFLGSFITEPGAMTITALLLSKQFYRHKPSKMLAYSTLGLLFTNISVGGVLTNFAAPPVLMVSQVWGWSSFYMLSQFGYKAVIGVIFANLVYFFIFYKEFQKMELNNKKEEIKTQPSIPFWIPVIHLYFLFWMVLHVHYPVIFMGSFLLFLGFYKATHYYQEELKLRGPILVGFFLAGLVVHGGLQAWWISPMLSNVSSHSLMVLSTILTAFNDNAAITYLTTLIPSFDALMKYAVVAGAVTGGGLTIIANAPNPAGAAILEEHFEYGISFSYLFLAALIPTLIVGLSFYLQGVI